MRPDAALVPRSGVHAPPARNRTHCSTFVTASVYRLGAMPDFRLVAPFEPTGDQPQAIERLVDGLGRGLRHQTLLGVTGTGKTFTMAETIDAAQQADAGPRPQQDAGRPAVHRVPRVLPGQRGRVLRQLLRLLPAGGVPAAVGHVHREGLVSRNEEIDRLRHAATHALFERRDVIIVASVSCIYGLGAPVDYGATVLRLKVGGQYRRDARAAPPRGPPVPAQRRGAARAPGSASAATRWRSGRPLRGSSSGSSSSATRSSGSPSWTRSPASCWPSARSSTSIPATHFVTPADKLPGGDRRHRGRDGGAGRPAGGARAGRSRRRASASGRRSTSR